MRPAYLCFYSLLFIFFAINASGQENCKVFLPGLKGMYVGDCIKGRAEGFGKAQGRDEYTGEFKDGLPNGKGLYKYDNGDYYDGNWSKGKKDGLGSMTFKRKGKKDSIVAGFWEKGSFIGKLKTPYIIHQTSGQVNRTQVKYERSPLREITVIITNITGSSATLGSQISAAVYLSDISLASGNFIRLVDLFKSNKQTAYKLMEVSFPMRAKFLIQNQEVDAEFLEPGKYTLEIALNN